MINKQRKFPGGWPEGEKVVLERGDPDDIRRFQEIDFPAPDPDL